MRHESASDDRHRRETLYGLEGVRLDAYDEVVKPDRVLPVRLYTLRRWAPELGATGFWLLVTLQQACYRNPQGRDWCTIGRASLAERTGVNEATVQRYLHRGEYGKGLRHWIQKVRGRRRGCSAGGGQFGHPPNRYQVVMDAPLARIDQRGIAQVLQERGGVPGAPTAAVERALKELAELPLECLMAVCEEAAAGFTPPVNWDESEFYPTVADVVTTLGLQTSNEEEEAAAFREQCSRVQQAFVGRAYLGTQYFRREWVPVLGHKLALAVLQLRSRCFWNQNEARDEVALHFTQLAQEAGCSARWLRTINETHPLSQAFFRVRSQGRGKSPVFNITLIEPIAPQHHERYDSLLRSGADVAVSPQPGLSSAASSAREKVRDRCLRTEPMHQSGLQNGTRAARTEPVHQVCRENGIGAPPRTERVNVQNGTGAWGTEPMHQSCPQNGMGAPLRTEPVHVPNGTDAPHVSTVITVTNTDHRKALKKQQQARPAATATVSLLKDFGIGPPNDKRILDISPSAEAVRAWMLYAVCEPGLQDPRTAAGYVVNRLLNQDEPPARFGHWAMLTADEWRLLWRAGHYGGKYADRAKALLSRLRGAGGSAETHLVAWQRDFESIFPNGPFGGGRVSVEKLEASIREQLSDAPGFSLRQNGPALDVIPDTEEAHQWLVEAKADLAQLCERRGVYHSLRICACPAVGSVRDSRAQATEDLWEEVLSELRLQMTNSMYETCLHDTRGHCVEGGVLEVVVPNARVKEWLDARLMHVVRSTLQRVTQGEVPDLEFVVPAGDGSERRIRPG